MKRSTKEKIVFWSFLAPVLLAFIIVIVIPFMIGIYYSFTNWDGIKKTVEFVGLQNYKDSFANDPQFFYSIMLTVVYTIINIIAVNLVSFSLAMLVTRELKLKNFYRVGFFIPNLIGGLILGYVWQFIFNNAIPALGTDTLMLADRNSAVFALIIAGTWQYAGYIMMIYITALQNVPKELIEASEIDGATAWQKLLNITLPMVAPAFTVTLFLTLVNSFKQFDVNVSLTVGGPSFFFADKAVNGTELLALNIYNEAFVSRNMALGQAKAVIFFAFLLAISLVQVYFNKRKEVEL